MPRASGSILRAKWRGLLSRLGLGRSEALGPRGERLAAAYLEANGYDVVERNFRVRGGEADLVVRRGDLVVVVEVKTRASLRFGAPSQAITTAKSNRVYKAGCAYCRERGFSLSRLRCDVITVDCSEDAAEPELRHYKAAISPPGRRR